MEGGIAFILLFVIVIAAIVLGVALYLTGGALWFSKPDDDGDHRRPRFKHVDVPKEEHVMLAGTEGGERENRAASRRDE
jgi:hypothetical protein